MNGSFLFAQLPSKRVLTYPFPFMAKKMMPWGEEQMVLKYWGVDPITKQWCVTDTYGGKLAENVTQAVARDVLAEAMIRLDNHGYMICSHVHDEIIVEAVSTADLEQFQQMMAEVPAWADGLPVSVSGWKERRYRK
jgi:DNA polymerase